MGSGKWDVRVKMKWNAGSRGYKSGMWDIGVKKWDVGHGKAITWDVWRGKYGMWGTPINTPPLCYGAFARKKLSIYSQIYLHPTRKCRLIYK